MNTFKIVDWGRWRILWVESDRLEQSLEAFTEHTADGLGISPYNGFVGNDIAFLQYVPGLRGVVLPYAEPFDLEVLRKLPELRFLTVAGNCQAFDYGVFRRMQDLRLEWHAKVTLPGEEAISLESLYLRGFKPRGKTLRELPAYSGLTELELNQGNVNSLSGIERFTALAKASFFYQKQLEFVEALSSTPVDTLHIEACKRIVDLPSLARCPMLRKLRYNNCGELPSLGFLSAFSHLQEFRFVNTNIVDGDLSPLLNLKTVGFLPKRHYSHRPEDFEEGTI